MMQSYASRVWLQSGGPILLTGIYAMVCYRVATTPDLHGRIRGHPNPTDELWSYEPFAKPSEVDDFIPLNG